MADFSFLKSFVLTNESDPNSNDLIHNFYPVSLKDVLETEQCLDLTFPNELNDFYKQIGYGFFYHKKEKTSDINRFIDPSTVADIYLREDFYEYDSDLDIYNDSSRLIFFEVNEGVFLTTDLNTKGENSPVYYITKKVADSIENFLRAFDKDPNYFDQFD